MHTWQARKGQDRYATDITVRAFRGSMEMLGGNNGNSNAHGNTSNQGEQAPYGGGYDATTKAAVFKPLARHDIQRGHAPLRPLCT